MTEDKIREAFLEAVEGCLITKSGLPKLEKITFTDGSEIGGKFPLSLEGKKTKIKSLTFTCTK